MSDERQVRLVRDGGDHGALIVLCGGASAEHEVSLASARSLLGAIDPRRPVRVVVLDRQGRLCDERASRALLELPQRSAGNGAGPANTVRPAPRPRLAGGGGPVVGPDQTSPPDRPQAAGSRPDASGLAALDVGPRDVVFPLLHGPFGEDGSVQGMLRLMGVPYVGSGVLASAVGMDKLTMKAVFAAHGLPQVAYRGVLRHRYRHDPEATVADPADLGRPVFVKPANLGSSVGISTATDTAALHAALAEAFCFDRRVIVEAAAVGVRELEVAVLGNHLPELSPVGEVRYRGALYDYASKYQPGGAELVIPARLAPGVAERATELARRAFQAIDAAGLARVDLFHDEGSGRLWVNEINTMPGFTATSMYPRLWAAAGLDYDALVERLVALAWEAWRSGRNGAPGAAPAHG
jgi:D-alanine-D-alanine ligase